MALDGTPIIIKKKKHAEHAHHGGSWKVAYADFVTAMMAFFLTLWIMGLSDSTRAQVSGYFNDPMGFMKSEPMSRNIIKFPNMESPKPGQSKANGSEQATGPSKIGQELNKLNRSITTPKGQDLLHQVTITWAKDGIRIEFADSKNAAFFELGSKTMTPEAEQVVKALAPTLVAMNEVMSVEGYTDAKPYTGTYDNIDLSSDRALSLKHVLQSVGVSRDLFQNVIGYGDERLKLPHTPFAVENRRVTIWLHHKIVAEKMVKVDDITLKKAAQEAIRPADPDLRPEEPKIVDK
ncbi:MAG TPA: flagellar motor protein MotB [Fimbriimonadaceae bacterium]|jgi:chemotaxis protein MotB